VGDAAQSRQRTPEAAGVCYLLRLAHQRIGVATSELMPDGRHPRDLALLRVIAENAPVSQQWLSDYLAINRSVMVKLIDGLEARGEVVRQRSPDDRRSYALRTTDAGLRSFERLAVIATSADNVFAALLSPDEHSRLVTLLQVVVLPHFDPPAPADLANFAGFLVAHARLRLEAAGDARLAPMGLTIRTFVALAILAARGPCSQHDLAAELDIGPAATVELVDELERLGTVRRSRNAVDRRRYALELTPGGKALLVGARATVHDATSELLSMLSGAERTELADLLAKLAGVADVAGIQRNSAAVASSSSLLSAQSPA
jgi:DNA-binding MarR family transcriptional regulator